MIWITEWVCDRGHSAMLLAWHDTATEAQSVLKRGEELFAQGIFPRTCRICGASVHAESQPTRHFGIYAALEEFTRRDSRRDA